MTPNIAPKSTVERIVTTALPSVNSDSTRPMNRPSHMPERTPPVATRPVVSRPVMRSIRLRSVPTIIRCSTGNFSSERKSTVRCAAA